MESGPAQVPLHRAGHDDTVMFGLVWSVLAGHDDTVMFGLVWSVLAGHDDTVMSDLGQCWLDMVIR